MQINSSEGLIVNAWDRPCVNGRTAMLYAHAFMVPCIYRVLCSKRVRRLPIKFLLTCLTSLLQTNASPCQLVKRALLNFDIKLKIAFGSE